MLEAGASHTAGMGLLRVKMSGLISGPGQVSVQGPSRRVVRISSNISSVRRHVWSIKSAATEGDCWEPATFAWPLRHSTHAVLSLQPYVRICRETTGDTKACEMQSAAGGGGAAAHMLD